MSVICSLLSSLGIQSKRANKQDSSWDLRKEVMLERKVDSILERGSHQDLESLVVCSATLLNVNQFWGQMRISGVIAEDWGSSSFLVTFSGLLCSHYVKSCTNSHFRAESQWFLRLAVLHNHTGELLKYFKPRPGDSGPMALEWGLGICTFLKPFQMILLQPVCSPSIT